MYRLISLLGIGVFVLVAWLLSENRKKVDFKLVAYGLLVQFVFAFFVLKTSPGKIIFDFLNKCFTKITSFTTEGSNFVFGGLLDKFSFALSVLPTIIFFSSFFAVLYYFGILDFRVDFREST